MIKKKYLVKWEFLPMEYSKINFDGYVKNGKVIAGYIIGDYKGKLLLVGGFNLGNLFVIITEVIILRYGIKRVFENGYRYMVIEGDSVIVI